MENNFTDEDRKKFTEFLNMLAVNARFDMDTQELITYFKLLAHMQQVILPKIDKNILEVVRVVEDKE